MSQQSHIRVFLQSSWVAVGICALSLVLWSLPMPLTIACQLPGVLLQIRSNDAALHTLVLRQSWEIEPRIAFERLSGGFDAVRVFGFVFTFLPVSYISYDCEFSPQIGLSIPYWFIASFSGYTFFRRIYTERQTKEAHGACRAVGSQQPNDAQRLRESFRFTLNSALLLVAVCGALFAAFRVIAREILLPASSIIVLCAAAAATLSSWNPASERTKAKLSLVYAGVLAVWGIMGAASGGRRDLKNVSDVIDFFNVAVAVAFGLGFSLSQLRTRCTRVYGAGFLLVFLALLMGAIAQLHKRGLLRFSQ